MRSSPPALAPCICDVALLLENRGMVRESQGKLRTEREQRKQSGKPNTNYPGELENEGKPTEGKPGELEKPNERK